MPGTMMNPARRILGALALLATFAPPVHAQWVRESEQFYLQAKHNWVFRDKYQSADRLFNAFDYGHAILYEKLWTEPDAPVSNLEMEEFDFLTKRLLVSPPRLPLEEAAIEVEYVKLAPEAKLMFEWAHILHRQLYDVLADERLSEAQKDAEVARVIAYYKTRPDLAFSSRPKTMELMQEQPYSLAFRQRYPKFNGLIWAYHWLQVGLYEPLLVGKSAEERQSLVRATVARFFQMIDRPVEGMPHQMPMTAAVAPRFAERYQEAAIIFDNLHSMHDVISDILANPAVPRTRKRAEILRAARLYRDDTSYVMTPAAWIAMSGHMGRENMGGASVGFLPPLPTPTVTYGAVMTHDASGAMTGFRYGSATAAGAHAGHGTMAAAPAAADAHAAHGTPAATPAPAAADQHAAHAAPPAGSATAAGHAGHDTTAMQLHMRMLADPVIRARIVADTAMHRMVMGMMNAMPVEHRAHMMQLMHGTGAPAEAHAGHEPGIPVAKEPARRRATSSARGRAPRASAVKKPVAKKPVAKKAPPKAAAKKPAPKKPASKADPHAGHVMPGKP